MSDFKEEKHQSESHPGRFRDESLPLRDPIIAEGGADPPHRILFPSESLATDGGLIAITDVSEAMSDTGLESDYRVVGGPGRLRLRFGQHRLCDRCTRPGRNASGPGRRRHPS